MPHALRVAMAIAVISGAVVTVADPVAGGDLNADTRALVAQLTAERAITLAKERRLADGPRRSCIAHDNPTSAQAQRDVSVSLNQLGNVAVQAGDLADAKARFEECLALRRKLAHDNPTSAEAQRDVVVSLGKLGKTTQDRKLLREALDLAQLLARSGRLAPSDSGMVDAITRMIDAIP